MKEKRILVLVLTGTLLCTSMAYAGHSFYRKDSCLQIDLRTGTSTRLPDFIQFVVPPEDSDGDGWFETVVKVTVDDPNFYHFPEAVKFLITYDADPNGMSVNIGDSESNNGFAGDGANQSNDTELQIGNLRGSDPSSFDNLIIYGRDGIIQDRGSSQIGQAFDIVKKNEAVSFRVANEQLEYDNKNFPIFGNIHSAWLYQLDGQTDTEGPVNFDIFAAFNRVITNGRLGSGVGKVEICPARLKDWSRDSKADELYERR
jgi:hypothetical protein